VSQSTTGEVIPFGVVPDFKTGPCSQSFCVTDSAHYFRDVTSVHSHELAEAVTDPDVTFNLGDTAYIAPSAWCDLHYGEIGDICNYQEQALTFVSGRTWYVQRLWSNAANKCVAL
jgi:hypothetical protein